jgi:hypothetical protein
MLAHDVFISYSHVDKCAADAARVTLEGAGIRAWIAHRDILPGAEWGEAIIDAINHSSIMVLIFSSNANKSQQIPREVERAVSKGVKIVPVRIEQTEPTGSLAYFMAGIHWLDAVTPPLEEHLQRLVISIKALLSTAPRNPENEAGQGKLDPASSILTEPPAAAMPEPISDKLQYAAEPATALASKAQGESLTDPDRETDSGRSATRRQDFSAGTSAGAGVTVSADIPFKSLKEIAQLAANCRAPEDHVGSRSPPRADLLVDRVESIPAIKERLARATLEGYEHLESEVVAIIRTAERGELDLKLGDRLRILLALRSASNWSGMVRFAKWADAHGHEGQPSFTSIIEVGQQYAMALNRLGGPANSNLAEGVLLEIIDRCGGDSETFGALGRVYKDRWLEFRATDPQNGFLAAAVKAYWRGLECNPGEIYPAINALTLMTIAGYKPDTLSGLVSHIDRLLNERLQSDAVDYFDLATSVELHAVMGRMDMAWEVAQQAADCARAPWELETTARTLYLISTAVPGAQELAAVLREQAAQKGASATASA